MSSMSSVVILFTVLLKKSVDDATLRLEQGRCDLGVLLQKVR